MGYRPFHQVARRDAQRSSELGDRPEPRLALRGLDPALVMRQMGHTTPTMTLGVDAAAMDWADGERERLRALVEGECAAEAVASERATPVADR